MHKAAQLTHQIEQNGGPVLLKGIWAWQDIKNKSTVHRYQNSYDNNLYCHLMQLSHTDQKMLLFPSCLTGHVCLIHLFFLQSSGSRDIYHIYVYTHIYVLLGGLLRRMQSGTCVKCEP